LKLAKDEELKRQIELDEETWQEVNDLCRLVPLLKLMAIEGALQSPLPSLTTHDVTTREFNNRIFKTY
jgi:uncharacterized protein YihD (DUF1040 family)